MFDFLQADITLGDVLKGASVVLWSGLKYILGIVQAAVFNFGFIPSMLLTVGGGMIGVFFFAFLEKPIARLWLKVFPSVKSEKVKFNRRKRFIVKLKRTYGLAGIALLTPVLLQVPIGTILAMRLIKDFRKVSLAMLASFTLYSLILCSLFYFVLGPEARDSFLRIFHAD